jgi:hypothetical protein
MRFEGALKSDRISGIRGELRVGQSCPVCDRTITKLVAQRIGLRRPLRRKRESHERPS